MDSRTLVTVLLSITCCTGFLLDDEEVKFTLYRRGLSDLRVRNNPSLSGLRSFDAKAKTYFIIHGWNGGEVESWRKEMIDALLKKANVNVFAVNWGAWAKTPNYIKAKDRCDDAGAKVSELIINLEKKAGASRTNMHLIGHSLGGQVAGFAGANLRSPKVGRITGLDTSGIGFDCSKEGCLDYTDADFVDEIHTLVSALPKGHVDFYPIPTDPFKVLLETKLVRAHWLAADYFTKSILTGPCSFKSRQCSSYSTFKKGGCSRNAENGVGFYARKPASSPPNKYFINIDINKPC